jgi:hypothetical protein
MNRVVLLALAAAALAQDPAPEGGAAPAAASGDAPAVHAVELRGGTVLVGRIEPAAWKVKTAFGELTVPVPEVRRVRFGRRAQPERLAKVEAAVKDLASANPERRDRARAAIAEEGAFAVLSLRRAEKDHDPEVRRIASELLKELDLPEDQVLPDDDQIDTARFNVTGEVDLTAFKVHVPELGALVVKRADVARVRAFAADLARKVAVDGGSVWPNGWLDTKIKVEKGEPLRITASGTIFYPNWGQAFTPEGNPNMGMMNGMMCGTLAGRIGEKGTFFRVGSNFTGTAPASGVLYFILMVNAGEQPHEGEFAVLVSRGGE